MEKAKLIVAVMYSDNHLLKAAIKKLGKKFGEAESESKEYPFNFTDYYAEEFGDNLLKKFLCFGRNISKEDLPEVKKFTNNLEKLFAAGGKRRINIDPGYIDSKELVMASNKTASFKQSIAENIFAHRLLEFNGKEAVIFRHTFADYKTDENKNFFERIFCSFQK